MLIGHVLKKKLNKYYSWLLDNICNSDDDCGVVITPLGWLDKWLKYKIVIIISIMIYFVK